MEFKELESYIKKCSTEEALSFYETTKEHWNIRVRPILAYEKNNRVRDKMFQIVDEINRLIIIIDTQKKYIHFQKDNILRVSGLVACCDVFGDIIESEMLD